MNFKLTIEYSGTAYAGWQIQPHKKTVQGLIQDVLRRITQEKVNLIGASRTDAGVHALGQVAHFKTKSKITCEKFFIALAGLLPEDISVTRVEKVSSRFHAQKSARRKTYRYWIWNAKARPALLKDRVWHIWMPLDVSKMRKAAAYLRGRHDFTAFRAHQSDTRTSVRRINRISICRGEPRVRPGYAGHGRRQASPLQIDITGNGFLKYMVRNIVGTLTDVGKGRLKPEDVKKILKGRDRKKAGATAPAFGLYLMSVGY